MPGPAQVIDQDGGEPQLGVGGHHECDPPVGGLGAGQAGGVQAQVHLAEPVEMLLVEAAEVGLPQQVHQAGVGLGRPAVPQRPQPPATPC
jgi:hypothetical protein